MKIALGLGCDRGTSTETLRTALFAALTTAHAEISNVAAVASIDLKADEPALHDLAREFGWAIRFYPAAELAAIDVPHPSETVRRHTCTPSVSAFIAIFSTEVPISCIVCWACIPTDNAAMLISISMIITLPF